jgi:hypothetical protein
MWIHSKYIILIIPINSIAETLKTARLHAQKVQFEVIIHVSRSNTKIILRNCVAWILSHTDKGAELLQIITLLF